MKVVDYVQYEGNVYFCTKSHTASVAPSSSAYWEVASKQQILTVNNLLSNDAKLGEFSFSDNIFDAGDGTLQMNSSTGYFKCTDADITGTIEATSGTIGGLTINNDGTLTSTSGSYKIYIDPVAIYPQIGISYNSTLYAGMYISAVSPIQG